MLGLRLNDSSVSGMLDCRSTPETASHRAVAAHVEPPLLADHRRYQSAPNGTYLMAYHHKYQVVTDCLQVHLSFSWGGHVF